MSPFCCQLYFLCFSLLHLLENICGSEATAPSSCLTNSDATFLVSAVFPMPCFSFVGKKIYGVGGDSPILVTHYQRCHLTGVSCISYALFFHVLKKTLSGVGGDSPILVTHQQLCHLSGVSCISYASRCSTCWKNICG